MKQGAKLKPNISYNENISVILNHGEIQFKVQQNVKLNKT